MFEIREATIDDVHQIREVFLATYGEQYAYPQYYDVQALTRLVFVDGTILLVAVETHSKRVVGTASVVFSVGAYNDLVGEFGRLAVHPEFRGKGIGKLLMEGRLERVKDRLHVGLVENRVTHKFSQKISDKYGFVPVGFIPQKLLIERRESVATFVQHFGDALSLRRNNPRVIPEAGELVAHALENCELPCDAVFDDSAAPFPHSSDYDLDELKTEGYSSLLRIERGRVRHRDVFGPIRLHYGLFQLRASHSHYLLARRNGQIAGGIGFMIDEAEKAVRIFELIALGDEPIHFLFDELGKKCQQDLSVEYIEVDVNAYSPRMQRTLLELNFQPVSYIPANVFHEVERLDVIKMARLLVPIDIGETSLCASLRPIAETVIRNFKSRDVLPSVARAASKAPLFIGLNDEQRTRLVSICKSQSFQPNDKIFEEGDSSGAMYFVMNGDVELVADHKGPVATVSTGQCLGETSLLYTSTKSPPRSITAVAKTVVETAVFGRNEFAELIRRRPDIGVVIYRNLAADISTRLKASGRQIETATSQT